MGSGSDLVWLGGGRRLSLWARTMTAGRLVVEMATQAWEGHYHNGYLVFDYRDEENYKYAGMAEGADEWQIKTVVAGSTTTCASLGETIVRGQSYRVEVEVSGDGVRLEVDGTEKASCDLGAGGIRGGQVGLLLDNAHTHFREVELRGFTRVRRYLYLGGQRMGMGQDGRRYYLVGDHLGTTRVVFDGDGGAVAETRHYPYGEVRGSSGALPTDYRFTGQLLDGSVGLYHMGARWYDPYLARWLSADTLVPNAADPQSLNRYSWVLNNPLGLVDPSGHVPEEACSFGQDCEGVTEEDEYVLYWKAYSSPGEWGTARRLLVDWALEGGPESQVFGPETPLTQALIDHEGVQQAREEFYSNGARSMTKGNRRYYQYEVDARDYVVANWNLLVMKEDDLRAVLGSYQVSIVNNGDGSVAFEVYNVTTRKSLSRVPFLRSLTLAEAKRREDTGPSRFSPVGIGGNLYEYFRWTEPIYLLPPQAR